MKQENGRVEAIIKERERKKFLSELQSTAEREGEIPSTPPLLLRKLEGTFQYAGGVFLGLFLGMVAMFMSYVVSVLIFHI